MAQLCIDHVFRSSPLVTINANGTIQLANPSSDGLQGLQALTMTTAASAQQGTTILQYAQTSDGQQILVPSNQVVVQGVQDMLYCKQKSKRSNIISACGCFLFQITLFFLG